MSVRWWAKSLLRSSRRFWPEINEWLALEGYRGLSIQAFSGPSFQPEIAPLVWHQGHWQNATTSLRSPARRERDNASHHYGHDVQLKRHANLPLVGRPLPWQLEHGLKVTPEAQFEQPKRWSRGTLCMGPRRAQWMQEQHQRPAIAIGPWIAYAQSLLSTQHLDQWRQKLGPTLLVVLAHSWGPVHRQNDLPAIIQSIEALRQSQGYHSVIWLRHWQDPAEIPLPTGWIQACNGHRSNPWFLDAMRTLLQLSTGLVSNSFGTHLGYAMQMNCRLHWLDLPSTQNLDALSMEQQQRERIEWERRRELGQQLQQVSHDDRTLRNLLLPYWGFDHVLTPASMRALLTQ